MTTTANLNLTLIESSQIQMDVTANTAFSAIDAALTETLTVDASDTPVSVAAADVRAATHILITNDGSPAATGAHTVVLPAVKRMLMISNASGYAASIVCTADPDSPDNEVAIPNGEGRMVYCNAVRVYGAT